MKSLLLLLIPISLFLSGCANWALKERCEKTNWFEYSQKVAFEGRYLEEDGFIKDCKGVDRTNSEQLDLGFKLGRDKMCQYDEIFSRAKEGVPVFFNFCDGLSPAKMKGLYTDGLRLYCTAEKGYSFAKSGKVYLNLCNPEQEKKFLPAYYKGRREYLNSMIVDTDRNILDLKEREKRMALSEANLSQEYASLPNASECSMILVYNQATKQNENRLICQEAFYVRTRREELSSRLNQNRNELSTLRQQWAQFAEDLKNYKLELTKLP